MSKIRTSEAKTTLTNWEEVDSDLKAIAMKKLQIMEIESSMNEAMLKVQEKYQPELNLLSTDIIGLEKNIEIFCNDHKEDFGSKRSKELNYGIVAFRKGTPKLATLKGFTWAAVIKIIAATKKLKDRFLKVTVSLDKQAIINSGMKESELAKIGVHIDQSEIFSYEAFIKESKGVA